MSVRDVCDDHRSQRVVPPASVLTQKVLNTSQAWVADRDARRHKMFEVGRRVDDVVRDLTRLSVLVGINQATWCLVRYCVKVRLCAKKVWGVVQQAHADAARETA